MDKYLGENKIKEITILGETTQGGQEVSEVEFENGKFEKVPTFFLNQIITDTSIPTVDFMNNQFNIIASSLIGVMLEHDVKLNDIRYIIDKMVASINQNMKSADAILWGMNEEDKKMTDLHKILIENKTTLKDLLEGKK